MRALAMLLSLLPLLAGPACAPNLTYQEETRLRVFAALLSLGGHQVVTIAVDPGTYVLVVDHAAYAHTFHRSLGELDLSIEDADDHQPGPRSFSLDFGHQRQVRYAAALRTGSGGARFLTAIATPETFGERSATS